MIYEAAAKARKPLKKRRKKRRDARPRCQRTRCTRPAVVKLDDGGWCKTHARVLADTLAREIVLYRDGYCCQRCGKSREDGAVIQWCHVLSRDARSIRWDPLNSMALCQPDHFFFTVQPARWATFLDERWPGRIEELHRLRNEAARSGTKPDYAEIIASLRSQVSGLVDLR